MDNSLHNRVGLKNLIVNPDPIVGGDLEANAENR